MTINVGGESDSGGVSVINTAGRKQVYDAWQGVFEALSAGFFHEEARQLRHIFNHYPGFFIEDYMDGEIRVYALRPGVSALLDTIRLGIRKVGGGGATEVRNAVQALFEIYRNQGRLRKSWLN